MNITNAHFQAQREETLLAEAKRIQGSLEKRLESIYLVNENLSRYITSRLSRGELYGKQNYSELLNYESLRDNINAMEQIYDVDRIRIFTDRLPYVQRGNRITLFTMNDLEALSAQYPQLKEPVRANTRNYLILENQILPDKNIWNSGAVRTIAFYSNVYNTDRALVAVFMSELMAEDFLLDAQAESEEAFLRLLCDDGAVVCKSGADSAVTDLLTQAPSSGYALKDGHLIYARTLSNVDWRLEIALPVGAVGIRGTLAEVYVVIIMLSFILALIVALVISNQTTRRLGQYLEAAKSADYTGQTHAALLPDQLDQLITASHSNDEIDQIMASFSALIRDNLQLISRMRIRDLDIAKYKFQVLQEQINPHFLYNVLETLRLCMVAGRQEDALHVLDLLTQFYRIALSKGQDTITIREELRMIQCYLEIENVGYEGRLDWAIQIDEMLNDLPIPKFLLQPLIENSIVHGKIAPGESHLSIRIDVALDDDEIVMRVTDNGIGIDPDTLERLRFAILDESVRDKSFGYGLRNVNRRIKLFYGNDYGLAIESSDGQTTNTIRIPIDVL